MRSLTLPIQAGCLRLTLHREYWPLEECLTVATRQNPRRLYLFVSKVLGKHWPVRPSVMRAVHRQLAAMIADLPGPLLVIGMAETATALGRGVAEEVAALVGCDDVLYWQSTRCRLPRPLAFAFDEAHSHAPDHLLYQAPPALQPLLRAARSLVLVDDEISTGRTLGELARACLQYYPGLERCVWVSITNWLDPVRQAQLAAELARPLGFPALIEGTFQFHADPAFPLSGLPAPLSPARMLPDAWATDPARTGLRAGCGSAPRLPLKLPRRPLLVIGTGEYVYSPFRVALALEEAGYDVYYQSTTRSPLLVGDAIISRLEFIDHHGAGVANYLYNLDPARLPVVIYEHPALLAAHPLPAQIGGLGFAVEDACRAS